jgi:hypothetical protein
VVRPFFASALLAYASALRAFHPALDDAHAQRLAVRVVGESDAAGIDARLVVALVAVESAWDARAVSRAGARGLGQLMPATAAGLGVDPDDAEANLHGTSPACWRDTGRFRRRSATPARSPRTTPARAPSTATEAFRRTGRRG